MKPPSTKEIKKSASLPLIKKKYKILSEESKKEKELLLFSVDSLSRQVNKVREIKIYLNNDFHKGAVDLEFLKDIENEYAEQYLTKMGFLPTKNLIKKLLSIKPIENCDFLLTDEKLYTNDKFKEVKIIHIYPSPINNFVSQNIQNTKNSFTGDKKSCVFNKKMKLKNVDSVIKFKTKKRDLNKEQINKIKNNNKPPKGDLVFNQENVQNLIGEAKEGIKVVKYFHTNTPIDIDLSPQNIRNNYIISKKTKEDNNYNRFYNGRGRINNISKSSAYRKNILNDPKYVFPINLVEHLNNEILKEINEPLETKVEVIIKDINYILDFFPIDDFINIGPFEKEKIGENEKEFNYKINLDKYEDMIYVLKLLHTPQVYKLIGLTLNLIYWVVFGSSNNIQIDSNTKQLIFLKILDEMESISEKIENKKILYEVFIPFLIIILRIEADVYFSRKFKNLFLENKKKSIELINEIITEIYDKHGYMNSFLIIAGKSKELKEKMIKKSLPRFKNKLFATSNYIEQIFNNDASEIIDKFGIKNIDNINKDEIERKKNFIKEQKVKYIGHFLNKINNNLCKRRLKPIFSIRRRIGDEESGGTDTSMINVKRFKSSVLNQIIFRNKNNTMINLEQKEDNNKSNILNDIKEKENDIDNDDIDIDKDEDEEKEDIYDINEGQKNKISKFDLSYKTTETKNTLIPNESKISSS